MDAKVIEEANQIKSFFLCITPVEHIMFHDKVNLISRMTAIFDPSIITSVQEEGVYRMSHSFSRWH